MNIKELPTTPFADQKPGTAGLRKSVSRFREPNYLSNFVQAVFDALPELRGECLILGGDGRYFNLEAAGHILRMAAANGVREVVVGRDALLSTPAAAHLIAREEAAGGFLLTASHNPGGPDGDFGIKFNVRGGGQASPVVTDRIHQRTLEIDRFRILDAAAPDLDREGEYTLADMRIRVVDPVAAHADLLESCFDFERIRDLLADGFQFRFDALHAVTGPYAREVFQSRLGAPAETVLNATPQPDFAGGHPDPNPLDAADFYRSCVGPNGPDLGAASDGDGDRNMILYPGGMVSPCDSLAVIAANHRHIPSLADGLRGVARSMPTSRALDVVAQDLGIPCHETPTGWRFFASLLDTERIRLCGEESFGTSSDHVREKDGLWAVLAWLQMVAATGKSVHTLLREHWQRYGRHYFQRHDYHLSSQDGEAVMDHLAALVAGEREAPGPADGSAEITSMDHFAYTDPVTGDQISKQGIRIFLADGARIVYRLSGTGTAGATLRIYLERYQSPEETLDEPPEAMLAPLAEQAVQLADLPGLAGRRQPDAAI